MIPETIRQTVGEYHATERHPSLAPFTFSGIYSLFPDEACTELNWPQAWPGAGSAG